MVKYFRSLLKMGESDISNLYHHIFSIIPDEQLDEILEQYKNIYFGNDPDMDKDEWFTTFHKSMRQCDLFQNCTTKNTTKFLTDEERIELTNLKKICRQENYLKYKDNSEDKVNNFKDEYKRFLEFLRLENNEKEPQSINGHLDMILWYTIHIDGEILFNTLIETFEND